MPRFSKESTLFVSDLDGTLLGKGATFPENLWLKERICLLHERGVRLTYATARTIQSAKEILRDLPFSAPVALMNGVLLRDMNRGEYLSAAYLTPALVKAVFGLMVEHGVLPFVYTLTEGVLATSYVPPLNEAMTAFMTERIVKYNKPFTRLENLDEADDGHTIYIVAMDRRERLSGIARAVGENPLLKCAFYEDCYTPDLWYLEIFSAVASKGEAIRQLRELTGAETVVVFGDNGNDLPMFREADYACAVENAVDEVKAAADLVIPCAERGGVIEFIEKYVE